MKSFTPFVPSTFLVLSVAIIFSFTLLPHSASAAAVSLSAGGLTSTSTTAFSIATTTRAAVGDTVQYQLNLSGTPLIAPQINIFNMGSTTMSGAGAAWNYATTTTALWTEGPISFKIGFGGTTGAEATTTVTQANVTGTNVTFDKTGPILGSAIWTDVDGSGTYSGNDTITLTWNESMSTSTALSGGGANAFLILSNGHTYGTGAIATSWNTAATVLVLTLNADTTIASGDTITPFTTGKNSSADVVDTVGNIDATPAPIAIVLGLMAPTGLSSQVFHGSVTISLASIGSTSIRYTTDGSTPTCSSGNVYSSPFTISNSATVKAVGCDAGNNPSAVVTAVYSPAAGGGYTPPVQPALLPVTHAATTTPIVPVATTTPVVSTTTPTTPAPTMVVPTPKFSFSRDFGIGALHDDILLLQRYLNAHGFTVSTSGEGSAGNEIRNFGPRTRAALARYQRAKGITPAVGYFGPKTRATVNADQ